MGWNCLLEVIPELIVKQNNYFLKKYFNNIFLLPKNI